MSPFLEGKLEDDEKPFSKKNICCFNLNKKKIYALF